MAAFSDGFVTKDTALLRARTRYSQLYVLTQDGPLSPTVLQVTQQLVTVVESMYSEEAVALLHKKFPPGTKARGMMGLKVGNAFHDLMYDLAVAAKRKGRLLGEVRITPPVTRKTDENMTGKGANIRKGADFVLRGLHDGEQIDAAWDFTTTEGVAQHYDRDVAGKAKRKKDEPKTPFDPDIQLAKDTVNYWSSYIAICY